MSLNLGSILDVLSSHAAATGRFDQILTHEPDSSPQAGAALVTAIWVQRISPLPAMSGLAVTSVLVELVQRVYAPMTTRPADVIDIRVTEAIDDLLGRITADFQLGGTVNCVQLVGTPNLHAVAGYVRTDGAVQRVMDIAIPCVLADQWPQSA